jgi:hypothetical protein
MARTDERREHTRFGVHAGNAEITRLLGPTGARRPRERARIVNWSRGGLLLKVPSPRRRFLLLSAPPIVREQDTLECVLRLPPTYGDIEVSGEVVRVERVPGEPDHLHVGLKFEMTGADKIDAMAALLEPKKSARLARAASGRHAATSERRARAKSERSPAARERKSQRLERPSQRLNLRQTETLELRSSGRNPRAK